MPVKTQPIIHVPMGLHMFRLIINLSKYEFRAGIRPGGRILIQRAFLVGTRSGFFYKVRR